MKELKPLLKLDRNLPSGGGGGSEVFVVHGVAFLRCMLSGGEGGGLRKLRKRKETAEIKATFLSAETFEGCAVFIQDSSLTVRKQEKGTKPGPVRVKDCGGDSRGSVCWWRGLGSVP